MVTVMGGDGQSRAVPRPRLPSGGPLAIREGGAAPGFALFRARGGRRACAVNPDMPVTWLNTPR